MDFRIFIMKKLITTTFILLGFLMIHAQKTPDMSFKTVDIDSMPNTQKHIPEPSRDTWDIQFSINVFDSLPGGVVSGAETDGEYIYASEWNSSEFKKYGLSGNVIEIFSIPGVNKIRDLTYDGQYFYGGRATDTLYVMDFENKVLINKIRIPQSIRALAYDSDLDVFYLNNWSTDISIIDKLGNIIGQFPVGAYGSLYGLTYDNWTEGGPYLWASSQEPANSNTLVQYSLITQSETGFYMDLDYLSPGGFVGGLFTHAQLVTGTVTLGIVIQDDRIFGLELASTTSPCNPPVNLNGTPTGDEITLQWNSPVLQTNSVGGYNLFRDNILINSTLIVDTLYSDSDLNHGTYSYQVSAVYVDDQGNLICESEPTDPVEITILAPCDPPTNFMATFDGFDVDLSWNTPLLNADFVDGYNLYRDDSLINTNLITDTLYQDNDLDYGSYSYSLTAVYLNNQGNLSCESDPDGPVVVVSSSPMVLGGNVFAGTEKMNLGTVEAALFENGRVIETFSTTINDTLGYYFFFPFYENQYYIQAVSDEISKYGSLYIPTYFGDVMHWEDATLLVLNQDTYNADIHMIPLTTITTGTGSIDGHINYQQPTDVLTPAPGVLVFLLDESDHCVAFVYSNDEGGFHFKNLGFGTYKMLVEMAGKKMVPLLYTLNAAMPSVDNISILIKDNEILIGIEEQLPPYVGFMSNLFPNPVMDKTYLEINMAKSVQISASIYSINGQRVTSFLKTLDMGSNKVAIDVDILNTGIYYFKVDFNDGHAVYRKLVVVD